MSTTPCKSYKMCVQSPLLQGRGVFLGVCVCGGGESAVSHRGRAEQRSVVKQRVIDGILMAQDGSISNNSRF